MFAPIHSPTQLYSLSPPIAVRTHLLHMLFQGFEVDDYENVENNSEDQNEQQEDDAGTETDFLPR